MNVADILLAGAGVQGALTIVLHYYIRRALRKEESHQATRDKYRACQLPPELMRPPQQLRPRIAA